jgi:copper oxidase (laccase) domain-containing protein
LYGTYTVTLKELKAIWQASETKNSSQKATATPRIESSPMEVNEEVFREQRRRKRNNSSENEAPQRGNKKPATYVDSQNKNKAQSCLLGCTAV